MPCYHPLKAMRDASGVRVLPSTARIFNLQLPCGQCVGCRLDRSRQWALRCMHEAQLHEHNCFITLTYDDDHLPSDLGLHHRDFQLFMKRLRKSFPSYRPRYYMCGEYGENRGRPHFHAILFGFTFDDLRIWRVNPNGDSLFRSAKLERLWPFGFSSIGAVTFKSCAYVSRYIISKRTGKDVSRHYEAIDSDTGEIFNRRPEYNRMSTKPGIGASWFSKYRSSVFPHDRVIHDGTKFKVPRYYDKLLALSDKSLLEEIKSKRVLDASLRLYDNTPKRLVAKEQVALATSSQLKRSLK